MKRQIVADRLAAARVTHSRRLAGYLLETFLFFLTLAIGWFIWLYISAAKGYSPAKRLLKVRIVDFKSGEKATRRQVWMREFLDKYIFTAALAFLAHLSSVRSDFTWE